MTRLLTAVLLFTGALTWGCASSRVPARPAARPFENTRRVAIVASGNSQFAVAEFSAEPGRTFDEVLKWHPYSALLRPLAVVVHRGINWLLESDRVAEIEPRIPVSPSSVIADAMARSLRASGGFDEVRAFDREPAGEERRQADAIVRLTVPSWGLVRVRAGDPDLVSSFADVRAQMVTRGTGIVLWEDADDVTGAERLPLASFTREREFTRQELMDVLERAGQRLASELLYARSAGR